MPLAGNSANPTEWGMETVWVRSKEGIQQGKFSFHWILCDARTLRKSGHEPQFCNIISVSGTSCTTGALTVQKEMTGGDHWLLSGLLGNAVLFSNLLINFIADAYLDRTPYKNKIKNKETVPY